MDRELTSTLFSTMNIMVNGGMMFLTDMASKNFLMDHTMKEIFSKESRKVMVTMYVSQESMKDISKEEIFMERELSLIQTAEFIKEDGLKAYFQVMVFFHGLMVIDMRESTLME